MFKKKKLIIKSNTIPIDILKNHLLSFPHNIPKYFKDIPKSFLEAALVLSTFLREVFYLLVLMTSNYLLIKTK